MKDALGHGSDPRGGAAHQTGVSQVGLPAFEHQQLDMSKIHTGLDRAEALEGKVNENRDHLRAGETLEPIHVVHHPDKPGHYDVVDGQHRFWAHKDEGKSQISAKVYRSRLQAFKDAHGMV